MIPVILEFLVCLWSWLRLIWRIGLEMTGSSRSSSLPTSPNINTTCWRWASPARNGLARDYFQRSTKCADRLLRSMYWHLATCTKPCVTLWLAQRSLNAITDALVMAWHATSGLDVLSTKKKADFPSCLENHGLTSTINRALLANSYLRGEWLNCSLARKPIRTPSSVTTHS